MAGYLNDNDDDDDDADDGDDDGDDDDDDDDEMNGISKRFNIYWLILVWFSYGSIV